MRVSQCFSKIREPVLNDSVPDPGSRESYIATAILMNTRSLSSQPPINQNGRVLSLQYLGKRPPLESFSSSSHS